MTALQPFKLRSYRDGLRCLQVSQASPAVHYPNRWLFTPLEQCPDCSIRKMHAIGGGVVPTVQQFLNRCLRVSLIVCFELWFEQPMIGELFSINPPPAPFIAVNIVLSDTCSLLLNLCFLRLKRAAGARVYMQHSLHRSWIASQDTWVIHWYCLYVNASAKTVHFSCSTVVSVVTMTARLFSIKVTVN